MAYKFLADLDLAQNELQNAVFQNLALAPTAPKAGQHYFNTSTNTLFVYNGAEWIDALSQGRIYTAGSGIDISGTTISVDYTIVAKKSDIPVNVSDLTNDAGYITGISGSDVTTALGFMPYNATNPSGFQENVIETIKVNNTAQTVTNKTVNITVPTTAADVSALPASTKYGASFDLSLNTTTYVLTMTLKDQDGTALSTKTVDFPIESVVVNGTYDSTNKKIVLTLQSGATIDVPVADLVAGLQTEITSANKLDSDLVDDSTATNKFVTAADKTTWNAKQDAISDLATIRSGAAAGATATQKLTVSNPALTATGGVCVWNINNTLTTKHVGVHVYESSTGDEVGVEVNTSSSTVTITINSTSDIASDTYFAVIIG